MIESTNASRLESIIWLADKNGADVDVDTLLTNEQHMQSDTLTGIVPTIGCEVEVKWSSLFPEIAKNYFGEPDERGVYPRRYADLSTEEKYSLDEVCRKEDEVLKSRFAETELAGIPTGADAYWEFANKPTYSWKTLATEVSLLMQSGLIPNGYEHSLHVTLGGVSPKGGGVCLLLSGLELMYVPAGRIEDAITPSRYGTNQSWARRGTDGIRQRYAGELLLDQTVASELRTLTVSSPEQATSTLRAAQVLGSILLSYRNREDRQTLVTERLSPLWEEFRAVLYELWDQRALPRESWGTPRLKPEMWQLWAHSLRLRSEEDTLEHETVQRLQSIVEYADAEIMNV